VAGILDAFRSRRSASLLALGFSSGLPLLLTSQTLSAWLTDADVSVEAIGASALVQLPYNLKWLWAPLFDRFVVGGLGLRRGWMLIFQLALAAAILALGLSDPLHAPVTMALLALAVATLSASQDVVLDAYNAEVLPAGARAAGAAVYVFGYKVGMLMAGTFGLVLADHTSWPIAYGVMAGFMLVGVAATLLSAEPDRAAAPAAVALPGARVVRPSLGAILRDALAGLLARPRAWLVVVVIAGYRFGDFVGQSLLVTFLGRDLGYSLTEIAGLNKGLGLAGALLGGVAAGLLAPRLGWRRALLYFGIAQATTNLLYALLATAGGGLPLTVTALLVDHTANTMGTAAFVAYMMSLCDTRSTATQYALLTSLCSLGARLFGSLGGQLAAIDWAWLWLATAAAALPALLAIRWLAEPETKKGPG
jgi:PAT family beta-lactamase induction signal transducer AmpG